MQFDSFLFTPTPTLLPSVSSTNLLSHYLFSEFPEHGHICTVGAIEKEKKM